MNFEALLKTIERIAANRRPRLIWGTFLTTTMCIVVFGFLRQYSIPATFLAILAAAIVSLIALVS